MLPTLLLAAASLLSPVRAAVVDRVAAVVNEEVITLSEVYDLGSVFIDQRCPPPQSSEDCRGEAELEVLDSLIMRSLIRQELHRLGLTVTGSEVDRTIDSIARDNDYETRDELRSAVEASGMRWDTYREQLSEQLMQMKFTENVVRPRVAVTDDELEDLYKRQARDYAGPPLVKLSATLLAVPPQTGPEALAALVGLAKDASAAINRGDSSWEQLPEVLAGAQQQPMGAKPVPLTDLAGPLAEAVHGLDVGQVSEPVLLAGSLILLRVDNRQASDVLPFQEVSEQLRQQVYEQKIDEEVQQWYLQARRRAAVKVLLGA